MFCEKCGSELPPRAKFCAECGAPVTQTPPSSFIPDDTPMSGPETELFDSDATSLLESEPEPFDSDATSLLESEPEPFDSDATSLLESEPEPFDPGATSLLESEPAPAFEPPAANRGYNYSYSDATDLLTEEDSPASFAAGADEPTFSAWRRQTSSAVPPQKPFTPVPPPSSDQPWQAPYYQSVQAPRAASQQPSQAAQKQTGFSPSSGGWSIPGGGTGGPLPAGGTPQYTPAQPPARGEKKPLYTRWWFWLIIVLVVLIAIAAVGLALVRRTLRARSEREALVAGSIRTAVTQAAEAVAESADAEIPDPEVPELEIPDIDIPDIDIPEAPSEPESPPEGGDSDETVLSGMAEEIEREIETVLPGDKPHPVAQGVADALLPELDLSSHEYEIEVDADGWITVYLWREGLDELSDNAEAGDESAIDEWEDELEIICSLSERIYRDLAEAGLPEAGALVFLQDDVNEDILLAGATDGTLIYDWVNNVDIFGLEEEDY